ncbi:MAG: SpoIVB peptidase S55 domain-containing protein, partial [Candidatus Polarisedimenticolia bacterium]
MRPGRFPSSPPLLLILLLAGGGAVLGQEILPFSEVRPGMRGVGKTVFSGTRVEDFQVEVIGTLERVAPQRNLILVRLSGGPLAQTGVLSGMSGSPVYLNDRLAGAVAYTWGFAREPIAGVTPIQEMLAIEDHERPAAGARAALPSAAGPAGLRYLLEPDRLPAHFASYFSRSFPGPAGAPAATPIGVPLQFSGVGPRVLEMLAPGLRAAGLN